MASRRLCLLICLIVVNIAVLLEKTEATYGYGNYGFGYGRYGYGNYGFGYGGHGYYGYVQGGFTIDNRYSLRWQVDHNIIRFRAVAMGNGFVGFGISPKGTMEGADLFMSGMYENGTAYAFDANGPGKMDAMNNYNLFYVFERPNFTEVRFWRYLCTSDKTEDLAILNEPQYIIWSIGPPMDKLEHHGPTNRGAVLVNLLNPPMYHSFYRTDKGADGGAAASASAAADPPKEDPPAE